MRSTAVAFVVIVLAAGTLARAQQPGVNAQKDHVAALKQSVQQGLQRIRGYEWIETTVISLKGEEKARKQNRCYYGADGKVQKVPIGDAPEAQSGGGGRGRRGGALKERIIENKKDEMQEYMEQAAALIHSYVPPTPAQIQAAKDAGRVSVVPQQAGRVRVEIKQYVKPGDLLAADIDAASDRLLGLSVNSYLEKAEDAVTLIVQMSTLPDGALYAAQTTLEAKAKNIKVVTTNSGHRPAVK